MEKEKRDFVINKGVLGWGVPVGILYSLTKAFLKPGGLIKFQEFNLKYFLVNLTIAIPIFCIGGYFWGLWMYKILKNKSNKK